MKEELEKRIREIRERVDYGSWDSWSVEGKYELEKQLDLLERLYAALYS